ncbi:MAG: M48 family metallopeptidase [Candidatus Shapirobacteria bacterium]
MINVYENLDQNKRKSWLVVAGFFVFVTLIIYLVGRLFGSGPEMLITALFFSLASSLAGYWWGDKIVLATSGARPANKKRDFLFYTVAENLALGANLPMPRLYVIEDSAPNAFATGRDPRHATICATSGLLEKLERTELEGVIAHELSHVRNYDMLLMTVVAVLVGMITLVADWLIRTRMWGGDDNDRSRGVGAAMMVVGLFLVLLSPVIAQLIQLSISRKREFLADASGVMITRYPEGLARALEKIAADREPLEAANKATAHLYISDPLKNQRNAVGWFASLFSTHPPVAERVKALRKME